jgi:hypothetical protein
MSRQKRFNMWLTDEEFQLLQKYAESKGISMAEVLRDYIKTLTPPKGGCATSHE